MLQDRCKVLTLLVVALSMVGALAVVSMTSPSRADTTTNATTTMVVEGSGTVYGTPDTYSVSLDVVGVDANANSAMQKANAVYSTLLAALQQDGYNTSLLTLSSLDIYPEYYYPSSGPAVFQDYRVIYSLQFEETIAGATASSLGTKAAGFIVDAVQAGANDIAGVSFSLSDAAAATLRNQALAQAAADAKGKAQILAQSLGVQVLGVQSVQEVDNYSPPVLKYVASPYDTSQTPQFNASPASETAQITVTFVIG
jgi:uncharacterized protein YggE